MTDIPETPIEIVDNAAGQRYEARIGTQVVGYTDSDGSPDANLALSQERADAVKAYLVDQGVPEGDLTTLGRGEADPIVPNDTPENKAKNRRIELIVQGS